MPPAIDSPVVALGAFDFSLIEKGKMWRCSPDCLDSLENRWRSRRERLVDLRLRSRTGVNVDLSGGPVVS